VTYPERNTGPEYCVPTWEELLVGVLARKVMPPEDSNRPAPEDMYSAKRAFRAANGDKLKVDHWHLANWGPYHGETVEWWLWFYTTDKPDKHSYILKLQPYEGELRLFQAGSVVPLDVAATEHLLGQIVTAEPLGETEYMLT
jgi:hypothetical protein